MKHFFWQVDDQVDACHQMPSRAGFDVEVQAKNNFFLQLQDLAFIYLIG